MRRVALALLLASSAMFWSCGRKDRAVVEGGLCDPRHDRYSVSASGKYLVCASNTWTEDDWAENPPVFCPGGNTCSVWHIDFDIPSDDIHDAFWCIPDKWHDAGRLLAIDPNNPHIVDVVFDGSCVDGIPPPVGLPRTRYWPRTGGWK